MKTVLMTVCLFASWGAYASPSFPDQCHSLPISDGTVVLPKGTPSLILIHNQSEVDLWITHPISDPSASAGWSSPLQSKHWSAFALGEHSFELSCIESKPGHEQQVPCSGVIVMCQWKNVSTTAKQTAPFWAGENMSLTELQDHLKQRGFKLPERKKG